MSAGPAAAAEPKLWLRYATQFSCALNKAVNHTQYQWISSWCLYVPANGQEYDYELWYIK